MKINISKLIINFPLHLTKTINILFKEKKHLKSTVEFSRGWKFSIKLKNSDNAIIKDIGYLAIMFSREVI